MPMGAPDDDVAPAGAPPGDEILSDHSLPYGDWLKRRQAQLAGKAAPDPIDDGGVSRDAPQTTPDGNGLPRYDAEADRFLVLPRDEEVTGVSGDDFLEGAAGSDTLAPPSKGPLTGRTPSARGVAAALDAIVGGPGRTVPIHIPNFEGDLRRGPGQDIHLRGRPRIGGVPFPFPVDLDAVLVPSGSAPGVTISGITVKSPSKVQLPSRVRLYNLPNGELDLELGGPLNFMGFKREGGRYSIG